MTVQNQTNQEQPQQHKEIFQRVEDVFLKNRNIIIGIVVVLLLGIGGWFGYKKLYMEPREKQAETKIVTAQKYFSMDSTQLALNGDGVSSGFLSIINNYGNTASGNMAKYYAGICYLKAKDFDNAIKYLNDYKPGTDELAGMTNVSLGHAYAEKNDYDKAIEYYKKAGDVAKSDFLSPTFYKYAGDLLVVKGDFKGAKEVYEKIKKEYPLSEEGQSIDKDIAYTEAKLGQ